MSSLKNRVNKLEKKLKAGNSGLFLCARDEINNRISVIDSLNGERVFEGNIKDGESFLKELDSPDTRIVTYPGEIEWAM